MFIISKTFRFEAAHSLPNLPPTHKCHNLHGHSYKVVIELMSMSVDDNGFVIDYGELNLLGEYIKSHFDHKNLNDVLTVPTTAENIARHIYAVARQLWPIVSRIGVSETESTWAFFIPDYEHAEVE